MEAARPTLPELPLERHEPPATPVRRSRHVAVGEALVERDRPAPRAPPGRRSPSLCGDAHAPSWLARGREAKYSSLSASADPLDRRRGRRTWRCRSSHENTADATGRRVELAALGALVVREERRGRVRRRVRTSTIRASGTPSASTVATVIAFGSATPPSDGLVVPAVPLRDRVGVDVGDVEPGGLVLDAPSPQLGTRVGCGPVGHRHPPWPPVAGRSARCRACTAAAPRAPSTDAVGVGGSSRRSPPTPAARPAPSRSACGRSRCPSLPSAS